MSRGYLTAPRAARTAERAARIVLGSRFVTIGTADGDGPWAVPDAVTD